VPIKDEKVRVFGVMAVDTVNDQQNRLQDGASVFTATDIHFYQVHAEISYYQLSSLIDLGGVL